MSEPKKPESAPEPTSAQVESPDKELTEDDRAQISGGTLTAPTPAALVGRFKNVAAPAAKAINKV